MLTKQETIGRRPLGKQQKGKGNQENCSATWLAVLGLVSRLSLANRSDSESFLVALASLSQDEC